MGGTRGVGGRYGVTPLRWNCAWLGPLRQIADGFDHDAGGVAGQIGQRHFFHVDDLDAIGVGAGVDRAVARFALGLIQRLIAA